MGAHLLCGSFTDCVKTETRGIDYGSNVYSTMFEHKHLQIVVVGDSI